MTDYSSIVRGMVENQAQASLAGVQDVSPVDAVVAMRAQKKIGVPADSGMYDAPQVRGMADAQNASTILAGSPNLQSFIAGNAPRAGAVQDDLGPLHKLDQHVQSWLSLQAVAQRQARARFVTDLLAPGKQAREDHIIAEARLDAMQNTPLSWKDFVPFVDSEKEAAWRAHDKAITGMLLSPLTGVLNATLGRTIQEIADPIASGIDKLGPRYAKKPGFFNKLLDERDYTKPLSPEDKHAENLKDVVDMFNLSMWLLGPEVGVGAKAAAEAGAAEAGAAGAAKAAPKGGPRPSGPGPTSTPAGEWAVHPETKIVLNPDGTPMEFANQLEAGRWMIKTGYPTGTPQIFEPTVVKGEVAAGPNDKFSPASYGVRESGRRAPADLGPLKALVAQKDAEGLKKVEEAFVATKTAARSPEVAGDFVNHAAPNAVVRLDADAVQAIYDEAGIAPSAGDGLLGDAPFISQLPMALARGADIEVPLGDYLAATSGKPFADTLRDNMRMHEDGVSVKEAKNEPAAVEPPTPPVPAGMIRVYNGGSKTAVGSNFVANYDYANQHATFNGDGTVWYVDVPEEAVYPDGREGFAPKHLVIQDAETVAQKFTPEEKAAPEYVHEPDPTLPPEDNAILEQVGKASTARVEKLRRDLYLNKLFATPADAGMTADQFERYSKKLEAWSQTTTKKVVAKAIAQLKRERTPEWKAAVAQHEAAVEQELFERRDLNAWSYLARGKASNGAPVEQPFKLSRQSVVELYGEEVANLLPKSMFAPARRSNKPMFETIKAKGGVNISRMAKMLAFQQGDKRDIGTVSVKEVLQNSFDAVVRALPQGGGKIDITANIVDRTIMFHDNGTGMAPEFLAGKFLEIAGTEKGENAAGGFGIAKVLFLYGNDSLKVVTMKDGVASVLETSGPALYTTLEEGGVQPNVVVYRGEDIPAEIKELFPEGHGTTVKLEIPKTYKNAKGQEEKILFPYPGQQPSLKYSPLFRDIEVKVNGVRAAIGAHFPADEYQQFVVIDEANYTARVYVSREPTTARYASNVHILSNGLWQFDTSLKKDPNKPYGENLPYQLYIDVRPKTKPEDGGYPFNFNRQEFTPAVKSQFGKILQHIQKVYGHKTLKDEAASFNAVHYLSKDDTNVTLSDPIDITPTVPQTETGFTKTLKPGDKIKVTQDGRLTVNDEELPPLSIEDLKAELPSVAELKVDQTTIAPNKIMLHDNSIIVSKSGDEIGAGYALLKEKYGPVFDEFLYGVGETFLQLRNIVATVDGYAGLLEEAVGISIDRYRGLNILLPFRGMFVNPFIPESVDPIEQAFGILGTMEHELAHFNIRSHNETFPAEMQRIQYRLKASAWFNYNEFQSQFVDWYLQHADMVREIKEMFDAGLVKSGTGGFKDGSGEVSDGGDTGETGGVAERGSSSDSAGRSTDDRLEQAIRNAGPVSSSGGEGFSADEIAQVLSYKTGDEMLMDLLDLAKQMPKEGFNGFMKKAVAEGALARARQELGFDLSPESLEATVHEAVALPQVEDFLADELKALAGQIGLAFDNAAVHTLAQTLFTQLPVKEALNFRGMERIAFRTAKQAEMALLKGKPVEAFKFKQRQFINQVMLAESHVFNKVHAKALKKFSRLAKRKVVKGIDQTFLNYIHAVLEEQGFPTARDGAELLRSLDGVKLSDFAAAQQAKGNELYYTDLPVGEPKNVEEFIDVRNVVYSLEKFGRETKLVSTIRGQEDRDVMLDEMWHSGAKLEDIPLNKRVGGQKSPAEHAMSQRRGIDAVLKKVEGMAEYLDVNNPEGVFHRGMIYPLHEGTDKYGVLKRELLDPISKGFWKLPKEIRATYEKKMADSPLVDPRDNGSLDVRRRDLLSVALNIGNWDNLSKLAQGYQTTPEAIEAWLSAHLTQEEWKWISDVWATLHDLGHMIDVNERAETGVGIHLVAPRDVETPFGIIKGAYFPLDYDAELDPIASARIAEAAKLKDPIAEQWRSAAPNKGFIHDRSGYVGPINLNLNTLVRHLEDVVIRLAYLKPGASINRFIADPQVKKYVVQKMGLEYYRQFKPWLDETIIHHTLSRTAAGAIERVAQGMRLNYQFTVMGLNLKTAVTQVLGNATTLSLLTTEVGAVKAAQYTAYGMWKTAAGLKSGALKQLILDNEGLRQRAGHTDRELNDAAEAAEQFDGTGELAHKRKVARNLSMQAISIADRYGAAIPAYYAGEARALAEGATFAEAKRAGNKLVRMSQGSGRRQDLAKVLRADSEFQRWWHVAYNYGNVTYNISTGNSYRAFKSGRPMKGLMALLILWVFEPLAQAIVFGDGPKDGESIPHWMFRETAFGPLSMLPYAREAEYGLQQLTLGERPSLRAGLLGQEIGATLGALNSHSKSQLHDFIAALGYWGAIPGGGLSVANMVDFLEEHI